MFSLHRSNGGVPKLAVQEARLTTFGLQGDRQRNTRYHGGPLRALCLYSLDRLVALQEEGHPIFAGAIGENALLRGLDWSMVVPGVRLCLGSAEIEITSYTTPCKTIRHSFINADSSRIDQSRYPGWSRVYARVLSEGTIRVGDPSTLRRRASS